MVEGREERAVQEEGEREWREGKVWRGSSHARLQSRTRQSPLHSPPDAPSHPLDPHLVPVQQSPPRDLPPLLTRRDLHPRTISVFIYSVRLKQSDELKLRGWERLLEEAREVGSEKSGGEGREDGEG